MDSQLTLPGTSLYTLYLGQPNSSSKLETIRPSSERTSLARTERRLQHLNLSAQKILRGPLGARLPQQPNGRVSWELAET